MVDQSRPSHRNLGSIEPGADAARSIRRRDAGLKPPRSAYHAFAGIVSDRNPLGPEVISALSNLVRAGRVQVGDGVSENPRLPAGYTYLFQLAGHDLVSTAFASSNRLMGDWPVNLRRSVLSLETVLGDGARSCPFAYDTDGAVPTLRTAAVRRLVGSEWKRTPPPRDLPRVAFRPDGQPDPLDGLETVLIPDVRNDDNLILAQLTVLFHGIFNHVALTVSQTAEADRTESRARGVMKQMWRRILRHDLMARILTPEVFRLYDDSPAPRIDTVPSDGSPSLEFAFAAGRLGHAMVRNIYRLRGNTDVTLQKILQTSSTHDPSELPMPHAYLIDWSLFFPAAGVPPAGVNLAFRFGPYVAEVMKREEAAATQLASGGVIYGTAFRDLMREDGSQLASVQQIVNKAISVWPHGGWGAILDPLCEPAGVEAIVRAGLDSLEARAGKYSVAALRPGERQAILADPPLSLFLQFEAEQFGDKGCTLGPLGSLIVAEAMAPAFAAAPDATLEAYERQAFGALPRTMPELLDCLRTCAPHLFAL